MKPKRMSGKKYLPDKSALGRDIYLYPPSPAGYLKIPWVRSTVPEVTITSSASIAQLLDRGIYDAKHGALLAELPPG